MFLQSIGSDDPTPLFLYGWQGMIPDYVKKYLGLGAPPGIFSDRGQTTRLLVYWLPS